jgi:hypothetical protein
MPWKRLLGAAWLSAAGAGCAPSIVELAPDDPHLEPLAWMAGSWSSEQDGTRLEEHWIQPSGATMLGVNRTVRDGRTVFFEYLRIERSDDGVVLQASPLGRAPTVFTLVELTEGRVVFENPDHDFPQRIIYWRDGDELRARIEGDENGVPKASEWSWRRARFVTAP